jgi:hypothetical protein
MPLGASLFNVITRVTAPVSLVSRYSNSRPHEKKRGKKFYIVLVKSDALTDTGGLTSSSIGYFRRSLEMKLPSQQISWSLTSAKNSVMKSSGAPTLTDTSSATSSSSDWACEQEKSSIIYHEENDAFVYLSVD